MSNEQDILSNEKQRNKEGVTKQIILGIVDVICRLTVIHFI
jgi:hypothetical protein